jgi:hypothetical protein
LLVPALSAAKWLNQENASVNMVSLDPSKRRTETKPTLTQSSQSSNDSAASAKETVTPTASAQKTSSPSPVASPSATSEVVTSIESQSPKAVSIDVPKDTNADVNSTSSPREPASETPKSSPLPSVSETMKQQEVLPSTRTLPKYGGASVSPYKYIAGKPYHPSKHFQDLRGLSSDKSGTTDLIQVYLSFFPSDRRTNDKSSM